VFEVLTYLVFGVLGLKMVRANVWFGFFMAPVVSSHLASLFGRRGARAPVAASAFQHPALNALLGVVLLLVAAAATPWVKPSLPLPAGYRSLLTAETPVAAVDYMRQRQMTGNVFGEQGFASYLIWAGAPALRVYVDPRLELYTLDLFKEYYRIGDAEPGWEELLAVRGIDIVLASPTLQPALVDALDHSPAWRREFADQVAVVFTRN
jgi:hypothetical protein